MTKFIDELKIFGLIIGCFLVIWGWPAKTSAQIPFGGRIVAVVPCTCNMMAGDMSFYIQQLPVAGTPNLIFKVGFSRLYNYFQLTPGSWILGNTLAVSSCWVGFIPFCVPAGPGGAVAPLISIVGTSGVLGVASSLSGLPGAPSGPTVPSTPTTPTTGSNGGGTNNNADKNTFQNEAQNRQALAQDGVNVTSSGNCQDCSNSRCTCVGGMSQNAINDAAGVKEQCPSCQVDVTGSTEAGHHNGCEGNCFDLQRGSGAGYAQLDTQIQRYDRVANGSASGYGCSDSTPCYRQGNTIYYQENSAHWHVQSNYFSTGR